MKKHTFAVLFFHLFFQRANQHWQWICNRMMTQGDKCNLSISMVFSHYTAALDRF